MAMAMGQEASASPQPPAITIPPVPSQVYLHHTTLAPRPKLILVGDSITEQGSSDARGWAASLSVRYSRRMDVVNRGMNGYTSRWGAAALPLILEEMLGPAAAVAANGAGDECTEEESRPAKKGRSADDGESNNEQTKTTNEEQNQNQSQKYPQHTFLIAYGANDSCLRNGSCSRHHVPLDEYSSNLKRMVRTIRTWNAEKSVAVALLTPPPCDTDRMKGSRDNEGVTESYAEACIAAASQAGVPVVDLWRGMQRPLKGNDDGNPSLFEGEWRWRTEYLSDGLHLTPMGNHRLYELVVEVLDRSADVGGDGGPGLGLSVPTLPRSYPDHSLVDKTEPERTFGTEKFKVGQK